MFLRAIVFALLLIVAPAYAEEKITQFDVEIIAEQDGDVRVTEKITVNAEGINVRRGIFRDLPRYYLKGQSQLPYRYDIVSITRNGKREPYHTEKTGNALRVYVGDADVLIPNGGHLYEITYEVKNQVRYFGDYDEIYWNATGTYWSFPIDKVRVEIKLPGGARALQYAAYTGRKGASDGDYDYDFRGGAHIFETTKPLGVREGITVSVGFEKGVVDPPSQGDRRAEWWAENISKMILTFATFAIGIFYWLAWRQVGQDPAKGPVFPRYAPPERLSPAAVHHVYYRGLRGHNAFIATLVNLAVNKIIEIDVDGKKKTTLTRLPKSSDSDLSDDELNLATGLLGDAGSFEFGKKYSSALTSELMRFHRRLTKQYGAPYFKWNRQFLVFAVILSGIAIVMASNLAIVWGAAHSVLVAILGAMALFASYFLPAPTQKGQQVRTDVEGFRLYLKTAEALQLNAVEIGSDAPPPMTVERYERFLPYAIALDVEKPWSEHFEKLMPSEAAEYKPNWAHGNYGRAHSLSGLNSALVSSMSTGVAASLPQSSGSSGSGGGGSSGGGGGGGGGGGW